MKTRQNAYKANGHSISDTTEQRPKVSWDTVTVYDQSSVKKQKLVRNLSQTVTMIKFRYLCLYDTVKNIY